MFRTPKWFSRLTRKPSRSARPVASARQRDRVCLQVEQLEQRLAPANTLSGTVFEDFNANGTRNTVSSIGNSSGNGAVGLAVDTGVAGVTVTVAGSDGFSSSTTTVANGTYPVFND